MAFTDLIIIYLACGSPFGVFQITKSSGSGLTAFGEIVFSFLLWPVYGLVLISGRFLESGSSENIHHSRIEALRAKIERTAFSESDSISLFEFREVFYRFIGLVEAANIECAAKSSNKLFEISGHRNKALASKCLERRNRDRLAYHLTRARSEFADLMSGLAIQSEDGNEIVGLAMDLAKILNDSESLNEFSLLLSEPRPGQSIQNISGVKSSVWKSRPHAASVK